MILIFLPPHPKYLSIGNSARALPVSYIYLRSIELHQVSFEDMNEILVVLRLITSSPNLEELQISVIDFVPRISLCGSILESV